MSVHYLKYYKKESRIYADLGAMKLSQKQCKRLATGMLFSKGIYPPPIYFDLEFFPYYQELRDGVEEHLNFSKHSMNVLSVVHEVAHVLHTRDFNRRTFLSKSKLKAERHHGPIFQAWEATLADEVRLHGWRRMAQVKNISYSNLMKLLVEISST